MGGRQGCASRACAALRRDPRHPPRLHAPPAPPPHPLPRPQIDDDCFVAKKPTGEDINALEQHIRNLLTPSTPDFFNTLYDPYVEGSDFVRGYPFSMREGKPTAVSHGLWLNIPDYDAPTQMVKPKERNSRYVDMVMTVPKVRRARGVGGCRAVSPRRPGARPPPLRDLSALLACMHQQPPARDLCLPPPPPARTHSTPLPFPPPPAAASAGLPHAHVRHEPGV